MQPNEGLVVTKASPAPPPQRVRDIIAFEGRFPSWEAFDIARKAHCEKTHTVYVCRNTVKIEVANKRRRMQVPESWEFDRKVYVCTHGYKRLSRSRGARPRQHVRYTQCQARFTAAIVCEMMNGKQVLCIKIVNQHVEHEAHPVDEEHWRNYPQNRASLRDHPYLASEAELLRRVGSSKRMAKDHIEAISGRKCTMKDMHNLFARLKKKEDEDQATAIAASGGELDMIEQEKSNLSVDYTNTSVDFPLDTVTNDPYDVSQHHSPLISLHDGLVPHPLPPPPEQSHIPEPSPVHSHPHHPLFVTARLEAVLQHFVDAHVENHVSILSADDGSNEAICIASKGMKEHFQVFPELCLLDLTASHPIMSATGEMNGNALYGFMAMDALGNSKPIFLSQTNHASEKPLFRRICQDFKRTHPRWTDMKLIVMDKLMPTVVDVLREEFMTVRLLLCQFHVIKHFSTLVVAPEMALPQIETQDAVLEILKELVFAHSEQYYQDMRMLLIEHLDGWLDHPMLLHIEQVWEPYRRLWVSYWRLRSLEFSSFFSKGFEAFWNPLKRIFEPQHELYMETNTSGTPTTHTLAMNRSPTILSRSDNHLLLNTPTNGGSMTIATCMSAVITTIRLIEEEWTSKRLVMEMTTPMTEYSAGSVLHFLVNCLSSFAVGLESTQLVTANTGLGGSVTVVKGQAPVIPSNTGEHPLGAHHNEEDALAAEGTVVYFDKVKKKKHVMKRDCSGCDCEFYVVYQLPCQHLIWYEISYLHHRQLSMSGVGQRWFLRTFQIPKLTSVRESNEIEYHIL